jgi:hypothetical protein
VSSTALAASTGVERLTAARVATSLAIRATTTPAGETPLLSEADVVDVASDYGDPTVGDGLDRLATAMQKDPLPSAGLVWLGDSGQALALDRTTRDLSAAELGSFSDKLRPIVANKQTDALVRLLAPTS